MQPLIDNLRFLIGKTLHEAAVLNGIDIGWGSPGAPPEVKRSERWIEPYVIIFSC